MISRTFFGVIKGGTRSLDHSSYPAFEYSIQKTQLVSFQGFALQVLTFIARLTWV